MMNIKELKEIIKDAPDDLPVFITATRYCECGEAQFADSFSIIGSEIKTYDRGWKDRHAKIRYEPIPLYLLIIGDERADPYLVERKARDEWQKEIDELT